MIFFFGLFFRPFFDRVSFFSRLSIMSSTTSQKFRDFTGEPLKDKLINEVPGLGPKLAGNLQGSGITKVRLDDEGNRSTQ